MHRGTPRRRRARPVADAPVDALLDRIDDLAKGWLLELVDQAPLGHAGSILAGELASAGPRVCEAAIRALASDSELAAIELGGQLEPLVAGVGLIAGARGPEDASHAVDALMAVLWSAIRIELRDPDADLVSELAERLTHVIEAIRGAALTRLAGGVKVEAGAVGSEAPGRRAPVSESASESEPARASAVAGPTAIAWPSSPRRGPRPPTEAAEAGRTEAGRTEAGRTEAAAPNGPTWRAPELPRRPGDDMSADSRIRSWPGGLEPPPRPRSVRSEALWIGAIDDEVERAERSGAALSLLLVELEDADRVLSVADPGEASLTFRRFAQAVRTVVRRQDILACESDSRAWIIARGSDRAAAQALATRIEQAVRAEPPWRGAPMTISVGLSVLGEDGRESATLMDVADEARFAATAEGVGVGESDPAAAESAPPRGGPRRIG